MPADDLSLAIRIRADVQQALGGMAKVNDRLGDTGERGREATRSLEGVVRAALEAVDAHEALAGRTQAAFAAMVEDARAAAREQAEAGGSWIDQVRAELERFRQGSDDVAEETRDVTVGAFRSMERALARFVTTGKLSFSGFVDSVIADLARLAARRAITRPLAGLIAGALPGLLGGGPAAGDSSQSTQAIASQGAGVRRGGETAGPAQRRSIAEPPAQAARTSHGHVRGRTVPPGVFDGAPRFHSGGIAGLRPDGGIAGLRPDGGIAGSRLNRGIAGLRPEEIPVIVRRGEAIVTPQQLSALRVPRVSVQIENRGTPQREVGREVRLDPTGLVVAIVTDDLMQNGPIRQTMRRALGVGETVL